MVSFFGLKFGADKRKKDADADPADLPPLVAAQHEEWERTRPSYKDGYISPYAALQSDIKEGVRRPRTAQSNRTLNPTNTGSRLYAGGHLMASSMSNLHDSDFRGVGSGLLGTTSTGVTAGSRPSSSSLRAGASERDLRSSYLFNNISSTSLAAPPPTSEKDLRSSYLFKNISSTSLAAPPPTTRLGEFNSDRPGTAHSMRHFGHNNNLSTTSLTTNNNNNNSSSSGRTSKKPSLEISVNTEIATPTFGGAPAPPKSPLGLGQYELTSPVKSDTASLFGDETPERIAQEISNRINREEEMNKARVANEERRRVQAELEAQRRTRNMMDASSFSRPPPKTANANIMAAYPSPPASIEGEQTHEKPAILGPAGPKSSPRMQGGAPFPPQQDRRPGPGPGPGPRMYGPPGPRPGPGPGPGPRPQMASRPPPPASAATSGERPGSRGGRLVKAEGPSPSARQQAIPGGAAPQPQRRDGSQSREAPPAEPVSQKNNQMLRPLGANDTTTAPKPLAPRSPLFQQMNPFDVHSDEEDDIDDSRKPTMTTTGTGSSNTTRNNNNSNNSTAAATQDRRRAPYGIPSPPLSHRQRPSDEQQQGSQAENNEVDDDFSMPIIRTVEAKRDTILVGGPGRTSLGLQIEEFERTLQQAQAMSALENKGAAPGGIPITSRHSRLDSTASSASNYSEMSESPMTIEPPLVSPKPFPLSPRPMGPAVRFHPTNTSSSDNLFASTSSPLERPLLEAAGSERTFGPMKQGTDVSAQTAGTRRPTFEESRPSSPAAVGARPRPRIPGASALSRPTLEEYGKVKVANANPTSASRVHRPSPDEYGPVRIKTKRSDQSPFRSESPFSAGSGSTSTFRMDSPILKVVTSGTVAIRQDSMDSIGGSSSSGGGGSSSNNSLHSSSRTNSPAPTTGGTGSYSVFSPPPSQHGGGAGAAKRNMFPSSASITTQQAVVPQQPQQAEWFGPAPTAPPTSPLPIPERNAARRKNTLEVGAPSSLSSSTLPAQHPLAKTSLSSPGLASSASIVPNIDANPNWPLPGPSSFVFPPPAAAAAAAQQPQQLSTVGESGVGFAARRSLHQGAAAAAAAASGGTNTKRAPPAPLNIAATKYADEVVGLADAENPWTPDGVSAPVTSSPTSLDHRDKRILPPGASSFNFDSFSTGGQYHSNTSTTSDQPILPEGEDKASAIGIARGLSIRYDRVRADEQQRSRGRTRERAQRTQQQKQQIWRLDEDAVAENGDNHHTNAMPPTSPTLAVGEPFDRLYRPNHGLKSPTGIADEQGIRFI